jgi:5'-3' exonuclease
MNKSSLSELFSVEDQQIFEKQNERSILIFDSHNMAYRTLFSAIFMNPLDNEKFFFWKYLFMNSFFQTIVKFNPFKVILAFDTKGSWRYQHFSDYKCNRKSARDKAVIDFDKFFPIFEEFKNDIRETFSSIYVLEYPRAEADDIIAVLCKEQFKSNQNIIVSTDKDLHQLLIEKNNQQFDPINNKIVNCINPQRELDLKIIAGDKSDSIPAIKSRIGKATSEVILKHGIEDFLKKEGKEIQDNYIRNKILIDFNFIPKDLGKEIINTYCNYQIKPIDGLKVMNFFSKHRLNKMMENWQIFGPLIKSLK